MKTINSKKSDSIKFFIDPKTKVQNGFAGNVKLYDSQIYVDTRDGTGYDKVIDKLMPLVYKLAMKYHFNGNTFDDTKHDVIIHILEGIPKYNSRKNTKLSTFIEMRVNRRLINELRNCSRVSRNATFLNIGLYQITCECGTSITAAFNGKKGCDKDCKECGKPLNKTVKQILLNTPEVNESMLGPNKFYEDFVDAHTDFGTLLGNTHHVDEQAIFLHDMKNWLCDEDPRVVKIIELYCFQDYSIKAAAEAVGLSGAGGNMKLKELAKNPHVREILGR